jgi:hypothetical protein
MFGRSEKVDRIAVITVHGTGDTAPSPDGVKWWQRGSPFVAKLSEQLTRSGAQADIIPFQWSGANNMLDRERASYKLAKAVQKMARSHNGVHVIGHSHGGTVANDAAIQLKWGRRRGHEAMSSLTTVGTPYLYRTVNRFQTFGAYAFFALALASAAIVTLLLLISVYYQVFYARGLREAGADIGRAVLIMLIALAVAGVVLYFMFNEGIQGLRRVTRARGKENAKSTVFAIWHPHDEAISALSSIGHLKLEPFGKGALLRGSQRSAVIWSVRLVLAIAVTAIAALVALQFGFVEAIARFLRWFGLGQFADGLSASSLASDMNDPALFTVLLLIILVSPVVIWAVTYLVCRLFVGVIPEYALRRRFNTGIGDVFRGMAYGSVGDLRPEGVRTSSPAFLSRAVQLDGELADRMKNNAAKAADALLEKYRWTIFNVAADHPKVAEEIYRDTSTWDSLIHTTYFDQPEVSQMIAEHIIEATKAPAPK